MHACNMVALTQDASHPETHLRVLSGRIRLQHKSTGAVMHATGKMLPDWGFQQIEVVGFRNGWSPRRCTSSRLIYNPTLTTITLTALRTLTYTRGIQDCICPTFGFVTRPRSRGPRVPTTHSPNCLYHFLRHPSRCAFMHSATLPAIGRFCPKCRWRVDGGRPRESTLDDCDRTSPHLDVLYVPWLHC